MTSGALQPALAEAFRFTQVELDSNELRDHVQSEVDRGLRDIMPARAGIVGAIYLALGVLNYLSFPDNGVLLGGMAACVGTVFVALAVFYYRSGYQAYLANWFLFAETLLLQADGMAFLVISDDVMNSYGVFVMILASGIFMSRAYWLAAAIAMISVSWLAVLLIWQIDVSATREGLMLVTSIGAATMFFYLRLRSARRLGEAQLKQMAYQSQLEDALLRIETLSGLLPICANCKNIRDEAGQWQQVEVYVRDHTRADFSHSVCPDCMDELYPGI